jgi:adenosylcobinamide-GDP ribazoletransferase
MARTLRAVLADFGLAWRLLTVIPLPFFPEDTAWPAGRAAAYFPLIGLILGGILAGLDWLFAFILPEGIAATLLLIVWVGLTGMLHLDGFIDACDGLLPPRDPARRLEIMKDSRVGAFGVAGAILLLLLKFNGLLAVAGPARPAVLITLPVMARWAITWVMARYPLARAEGLSVFFIQGLGWPQVAFASTVAAGAALALWGIGYGLLLLSLTWLAATLIARFSMARIHGLTGDIYGTICEVVETILLITLVQLSTRL